MKYAKWSLLALYVCFILGQTILGRSAQSEPIFRGFLWELQNGYWQDIVLNIALFVPLGLLIGGRKGVWIGFLLSCGVELSQYVFRLGYCELDDLANNTIGAAIGALLYNEIKKLWRRNQDKKDG